MSERKKVFKDNTKRAEKIQKTMTEKFAKPIIAFGYFNTQAEARQALGVSNVEINKSIKRKGATRGFRIVKGTNIKKALTLLTQLNELV
jgi:hypothetical protein